MTATYDVIVLGASQVGKSAIVTECAGVNGSIYLDVGGERSCFHVYDTSPYEMLADQDRTNHIERGDAFILAYNVSCIDSFNYIKKIQQDIKVWKHEDVPIILMGTHFDSDKPRMVTKEEGDDLAIAWSCEHMDMTDGMENYAGVILGVIVSQIAHRMKIENEKFKKKKNKKCCIL